MIEYEEDVELEPSELENPIISELRNELLYKEEVKKVGRGGATNNNDYSYYNNNKHIEDKSNNNFQPKSKMNKKSGNNSNFNSKANKMKKEVQVNSDFTIMPKVS